MNTIRIFSGGAAHGLVTKLTPAFITATGLGIDGSFSAVGGLKARILAGERPDMVILTAAIVAELETLGIAKAGASRAIGAVTTAVALRSNQPEADVSSAEGLRAQLLRADALFFPDPELATAGIHFADVLRKLGIFEKTKARHRTFPNGATAMAALAVSSEPMAVGCTQLTEIVSTDGIRPIGDLPGELALSTVYTAAPLSGSPHAEAVAWLVDELAAAKNGALRKACGFSSQS